MTWTVHTRGVDGAPAQILIDDQFAQTAPIAGLINLTGFSIYCRQEPVNTFWHPDETEALDTIEDKLINACEQHSHGWCVYALRMATFGVREYYFYHSDQAELQKAYADLKAATADYRIEVATVLDPNWVEYRKYLTT